MRFKTNDSIVRYAVAIPTRGRASILARGLNGPMSFLTKAEGVFFAISKNDPQHAEYVKLFAQYPSIHVLEYWDQSRHRQTAMSAFTESLPGSVGWAREQLRARILELGKYDYLVMTDDNARFKEPALRALVGSTFLWERKFDRWCFMAGMHSTAAHFDRNAIGQKKRIGGYDSYPTVAMIFHCVSTAWLRNYRYPGDCFALEDRHMIFTAIRNGVRDFRVCMDAPFTKPRYQEGGQGAISDRMWKCGKSIERLAHDFPEYVGAKGTFPTPWKFIMEMADGGIVDRLPGGAMRRTETLTTGAKRHAR